MSPAVKMNIPSEAPPQTNFSKVKIGATFKAGGETYRKTTELTFEDVNGIEQYISPLFDRTIGLGTVPVQGIDTSAKIVKDPTATVEVKTPKKKTTKTTSKKGK